MSILKNAVAMLASLSGYIDPTLLFALYGDLRDIFRAETPGEIVNKAISMGERIAPRFATGVNDAWSNCCVR